ncbi:uncharacterized protein [Argopecten irradians]|uniref:uncharacterized protein n=1 Tax=Argopecten irradians TaxID=31199 RepID=UPI00371D1EBC
MQVMELTYRDYHNRVFTHTEKKMMELDRLKLLANKHLGRLHQLKMRYIDWFNRKHQSFLDSIKLIHTLGGSLLPFEVDTIRHYRRVRDLSRRFPRNGTPRDSSPVKMDEFISFWEEMYMLKHENDALFDTVEHFCHSIRRLRQPEIKDEIDRLHYKLNLFCAEDYKFTELNNERDNLFTYKVAPHDHKYHGLMNFIPFLLGYATRLCYWTSKLYIEKS